MSDTFLVRFTAENQISAEMRIISEQLLELKGVAESALAPLSGVNSRLTKLAGIDLNPVANSVTALNSALSKLTKIDANKLNTLQSALTALNSVTLTKLANQMDRLAVSTPIVAKNMAAIAGALGKIDASNVNISVNAPVVAPAPAPAYTQRPATFVAQPSAAMPAINRMGSQFGGGIPQPKFNLSSFEDWGAQFSEDMISAGRHAIETTNATHQLTSALGAASSSTEKINHDFIGITQNVRVLIGTAINPLVQKLQQASSLMRQIVSLKNNNFSQTTALGLPNAPLGLPNAPLATQYGATAGNRVNALPAPENSFSGFNFNNNSALTAQKGFFSKLLEKIGIDTGRYNLGGGNPPPSFMQKIISQFSNMFSKTKGVNGGVNALGGLPTAPYSTQYGGTAGNSFNALPSPVNPFGGFNFNNNSAMTAQKGFFSRMLEKIGIDTGRYNLGGGNPPPSFMQRIISQFSNMFSGVKGVGGASGGIGNLLSQNPIVTPQVIKGILSGISGASSAGVGAGASSGGVLSGIIGKIFGGAGGAGGGIGGGTGAMGAGGGGGMGGFAASAISAYAPWMKLISIFNSVSFTIQTVIMAFQHVAEAIQKANEQVKTEATLMALVKTQYSDAAMAANQYQTVVGLAISNQQRFGGTLKQNIDELQKFQQIAVYSGVSVTKLNETAQLLALRDPVQGVQGAIVAMQELFSGDSMSLRRRFELPASETNAMAKAVGNADLQLQMLNDLLAKNGITADVLNAKINTVAFTYDKFAVAAEQAGQAQNVLLSQMSEPIVNWLQGFMINSATGINPLARLQRSIFNLFGDTSKNQTETQKALYDQYVRSGDIADEQRLKELKLKDAINAAEDAVKSRTASYANYFALLEAKKISPDFATQIGVRGAQDKIAEIGKTSEQTKQQMLLTAAVTAYNQGNEKAAQILSSLMIIDVNSKENSIKLAQEMISEQAKYNNLTQETANNLLRVNQVQLDMKANVKSQYDSAKATELQTVMDMALYEAIKKVATGSISLSVATMQIAQSFKISLEEARKYLNVLLNVAEITPDVKNAMALIGKSAGSIANYLQQHLVDQNDFNGQFLTNERTAAQKWIDNWENAHKQNNSSAKNNNDQLLKIQKDANNKLVQYDMDMYAKRMKALEDYYANALQLQQMQTYDMTLNNMDLLEGQHNKLEDKERQRLLARENIEAYHQLRTNDAIRRANEFALNGNAAFAQKYLDIQEEKNKKIEDAQWKLHDTQVRLEKDPEAQAAAKKIYDESMAQLDAYYNTRVGLAESASRQEQEADRASRKAIITDAIDAAMQLTDVDEGKRQAIIENLKIAGDSITDLSGRYITGVDAMRGSLQLLAQAMRDVKDSAQILTPDQLNMFNGLGSGVGQNAGAGSTITVSDSNNNTTVNVGGISVSVTTEADPNEIAAIVLKTLQSQITTRTGG